MILRGLLRSGLIGACVASVLLLACSLGAQSVAGAKTNLAQVQVKATARSNDYPAEAAGPMVSLPTATALKAAPNLRCERIHDLERPAPELQDVRMTIRSARVE